MSTNINAEAGIELHMIETPAEFEAVEGLQREVWPGAEADIVPGHILLASVHNGGLAVGAYSTGKPSELRPGNEPEERLVGFVFGFPGLYATPDGQHIKHHSHIMGVLPDYRDQGVGFLLKRAQWQMVRHQGLDLITWTYDPLQSRNAHLNIARLGSVCNTYLQNYYGEMRDGLNVGLPSDRFQVDWWVNSKRVARRLSKRRRISLDLAHYLAAGTPILNPTRIGEDGLPVPMEGHNHPEITPQTEQQLLAQPPLVLVEIPADFLMLKTLNPGLGLAWRIHTRLLFETLFGSGYLVTDFVHLKGTYPRSFYVLSFGESTL